MRILLFAVLLLPSTALAPTKTGKSLNSLLAEQLDAYKQTVGHNGPAIVAAVLREGANTGIHPSLLVRIIKAESSGRASVVTAEGSVGLMQLQPRTARAAANSLGLAKYNLKNIDDNVKLGAAYLKQLINTQPTVKHAIEAYNRGPTGVKKQKSFQYYRKVMAQ